MSVRVCTTYWGIFSSRGGGGGVIIPGIYLRGKYPFLVIGSYSRIPRFWGQILSWYSQVCYEKRMKRVVLRPTIRRFLIPRDGPGLYGWKAIMRRTKMRRKYSTRKNTKWFLPDGMMLMDGSIAYNRLFCQVLAVTEKTLRT